MASLPGDKVVGVEILRADSIGYPLAQQFKSLLKGHRFESLSRRGKYLLMDLDRGAGLAVHLRMSGRLLLAERGSPDGNHLRVRIRLESGRELRFEDMRVFGRIWFVPPGKSFEDIIPGLAELGVEPLEVLTGSYLRSVFRNKIQAVKPALLDQHLIAGIGNIYADESLFEAGINPLRKAMSLSADELDRLAETIRLVLSRAIDLGGSSIRDYTDSQGVNGNYQDESLVYGRAGQSCRRCQTVIQVVRLAGRSTHFCHQCQPRRPRRLKN